MIEGLKVQLSTEEVRELLAKKVQHEEERVSTLESIISQVKALPAAHASNVERPEYDLKRARRDALVSRAVLEHLIPNETYILDERDYRSLVIVDEYDDYDDF